MKNASLTGPVISDHGLRHENEELTEVQDLINVVRLVIENYTRVSAGTGVEQSARRAVRRLELALSEVLRQAREELEPAAKPEWFECHFCGAKHDLARDLEEFRDHREVSAVLLMRRFRYRFDHAAMAIDELIAQGFIEVSGPSLVLTAGPSSANGDEERELTG